MKESGTAPALERNLQAYSLPNRPPVATFADLKTGKAPALDVDLLLAQENWVRAVARHLVRDPARAEDVAQETMLAALQSPPRDAEDPRRLRAWLGRVAHNLAHLDTRRRIRRQAREERVAQSESLRSAADGVLHNSILHEVEVAVSELEEPYQSAVRARYFDGQSTQEIAMATFTTDNAVRKRLWRAREKLRQILDRRHNGERLAWFNSLCPLLGLSTTASQGASTAAAGSATRAISSGSSTQTLGAGWKLAAAIPLVAAGVAGFALLANDEPLLAEGGSQTRIALIGERVPVATPFVEQTHDAGSDQEQIAAVLNMASTQAGRRSSEQPLVDETQAVDESEGQVVTALPVIGGRVLHVIDGLAVAQVHIGWKTENAEGEQEPIVLAITDDQGYFELTLPEGSLATDLVVLDGHLATLRQGTLPSDQRNSEEEGDRPSDQVFVVADSVDIQGSAVDPNGVPVAGVEVALELEESYFLQLNIPLDTTHAVAHVTITDDQGQFSLPGLPSGKGAFLRISPGLSVLGAGLELQAMKLAVPPNGNSALLIALEETPPPASTLTGTVLLATLEPARHAIVELGRFRTHTDDAGQFELKVESIDPRADLRAWQDGWIATSVEDYGQELAKRSRVDQRNRVTLTLVERARSLEGYLDSYAIDFDWQLGSAIRDDVPDIDVRDDQGPPRNGNGPVTEPDLSGEDDGDFAFGGESQGDGAFRGPSEGGLRDQPRPDDANGDGSDDDDGGFDMDGFDRRRGSRYLQGLDPKSGSIFQAGPILPGDEPTLLHVDPIPPRPRFHGRLLDRAGDPFPEARIKLSVWLGYGPGPGGPPVDGFEGAPAIRWEDDDVVLTDGQGYFEIANVPARFCYLRIEHPELGQVLVPVPDADTSARRGPGALGVSDAIVFELARLRSFRLRVDSTPLATDFQLEDGAGRRLLLLGAESERWTGHLTRGHSPVLRASADARVLVLLDAAGETLLRAQIELSNPEEPTLLVH